MTDEAAYEFPEADVIALTRVNCDDWAVGEAHVFERVKVRDVRDAHVADGYVIVEE